MSDNILDRLAAKSRAGQDTYSGPKIPTIKFDGSGAGDTAGHFLRFDNEVMTDMGKSITMQIIRIRKRLESKNETTKVFSQEYDSPRNDKVSLRLVKKEGDKWGKPSVIGEGTPEQLRATNDVKVVSVVYGIINDELVKMTIKGASLTGNDGLYEYADSFSPEHIFMYDTNMSSNKVAKNRAITYHRISLSRGEKRDDNMDKVESYLDIINNVTTDVVKEVPQTRDLEDF